MFIYQKDSIRISVRQLVEFLLREGDIQSQGGLVANTEMMQEGSRIHRKIQKEQKITYRAEVSLKMEWKRDQYNLILEGRADGIDYKTFADFLSMAEEQQIDLDTWMIEMKKEEEKSQDEDSILYYIDEIKGVYQNVKEFKEAKTLHLAQAKCYAAIYLIQNDLPYIGVQLTYCNLETDEIKRIPQVYQKEELLEWFDGIIDSYKMWADLYVSAWNQRQSTIRHTVFPFSYREGQKKLMAMIYHSISRKEKVFFQAPTGIGKTISAIYPSLKILSQNSAEKVYYLTAKTITRTVAEDTLKLLREQGLRLKAVTLTAKEKICNNEVFECNRVVCEKAKGHYDRINEALYQILTDYDYMTREIILEYSERYQVCPYQLSFEIEAFCDFVICDYNYVFDPHVNRGNISNNTKTQKNILLIDEAHNLVDRARDMYSAELSEEELKRMKKLLPATEKGLHKKLANCRKHFSALKNLCVRKQEESGEEGEYYCEIDNIDALYFPMYRFLDALLEYLTDQSEFEGREELVELFFSFRHFYQIQESMTSGYRIYGMWMKKTFIIRLYCIDPSGQIKEILDNNLSAIFFSATLLPILYYRNLLYGESAQAYSLPSPFDARKRLICITNDVTSRYSRRNQNEYQKIIRYIRKNIEARKGNYMIFFPSYEMMENTYALIEGEEPWDRVEFLLQEPSMDENRREEFLLRFREENENSLIGLCVLGSIFSEGIDLSGDSLIGVLIVGTGIPKVCMERDMIRNYFDIHEKKGYDYAYRYPGMNKVLQAAGRVIRSVSDVGVITLMDERFLWKENQFLLPSDWEQYYEVNLQNYSELLEEFWRKHK